MLIISCDAADTSPDLSWSGAPRSKCPFPGVLETGEVIHHLANRRSDVRNGVTDSLNELLLLPLGSIEVRSDEFRESLPRNHIYLPPNMMPGILSS